MDTKHTLTACGLEPFIDIHELADYLGIPVSTIYDWRVRGLGPVAYRFGKHLKFAVSDVKAWIAEQKDQATPQSGTASPGDTVLPGPALPVSPASPDRR